jgi:hypothetical protein
VVRIAQTLPEPTAAQDHIPTAALLAERHSSASAAGLWAQHLHPPQLQRSK